MRRVLLVLVILYATTCVHGQSVTRKYLCDDHERSLVQTTWYLSRGARVREDFFSDGVLTKRIFYQYNDTVLALVSEFSFTGTDSFPARITVYDNGRPARTDIFSENGKLSGQLMQMYDSLARISSLEYIVIRTDSSRFVLYTHRFTYPSPGIIVCNKAYYYPSFETNIPSCPPDTVLLQFDSEGRVINRKEIFSDSVFEWGSHRVIMRNSEEQSMYKRGRLISTERRENARIVYFSHLSYYLSGKIKKSTFKSIQADLIVERLYTRKGELRRESYVLGKTKHVYCYEPVKE